MRLIFRRLEGEYEVRAGAELAGTGKDAVDQFLGQLLGAFGESSWKKEDGVDAGHLEVDGFAGILGFGTLYLFRVGREEEMLLETFGDEYRDYMRRTGRVIPRL